MDTRTEPDDTDRLLVNAAQRGDREAFSRIYEANVSRVYHYLLTIVPQPADAEDATAEVFIKAIQALPKYRYQGTPIIAWLLTIARNTAINSLKKQARRREGILEDTASISDDPVESVARSFAADELSYGLTKLTKLQRRVLTLRFFQQLSIKETAEKTGRTESAVKFLQHSAIRAMRRVMGARKADDDAG